MTSIELSNFLKEKKLTISSAESFTGGLFAREITRIPGASKIFKGAIVSYATEVKINVLGVPQKIVDNFGVVSSECAYEMADRVRKLLGSDIGVSFTGNAGPDTMENKPAGKIFIGVSIKDRTCTYEYDLNGSREEIQNKALEIAFSLIKDFF